MVKHYDKTKADLNKILDRLKQSKERGAQLKRAAALEAQKLKPKKD